jgi:sterol O-acyltransferase
MASNTELHYKLREYKKIESDLANMKKEDDGTQTSEEREQNIQDMLTHLESLKTELFKPTIQFPNNITVLNFIDYMLVPTLVYEMEYPRTSKFRPVYFLEKAIATVCTLILLYITVDQYIFPTLYITREIDFLTSVMYLITPFMVCYLLIFFIIFEVK